MQMLSKSRLNYLLKMPSTEFRSCTSVFFIEFVVNFGIASLLSTMAAMGHIGDFNAVLGAHKKTGNPPFAISCEEFKQFMQIC